MSKVELTYTGDKRCTVLDAKNAKTLAVDCSMTRGQEFGPEALVSAGVGSCMLISMAGFAERHDLDITGAHADVEATLGGKPQMRITAVDVTVTVPGAFTPEQQAALQRAAEGCPIKHSFRADTAVTSQFVFGAAAAAA